MEVLRNFNVEKYLKEGELCYNQRGEIEAMADAITARGYDNIVLLGIGGTWAEWYPVKEIAEHMSDIPIYLENAGEFLVKANKKYLSPRSAVLTSSASGDTKEIVEAVKLCRSMGIDVYGFTKDETTPLAKLLTMAVYNAVGDCEASYLIYYFLVMRLLYNNGDFDAYPRFADQMKELYPNLLRFRQEFEPRAREIAQNYAKEPYSIFTGSGVLWGETYLFTMCILEEMQWVRTKSVKSADFFHGTLELVEKGVPVFCIIGEDEYRPLDERVKRFAEKWTDKLVVVDTKDFVFKGIDEEFRVMCSPMIITALLTDRLAVNYELVTGHSLEFRRYYRQFEY